MKPVSHVLNSALEAAARLQTSGHQAMVVGGAVRDTILCREIRDADIATSASMDEVISVWPGCKLIGKPPRTTALVNIGNIFLDVSSFQGKSLEEDLGHRDLTINAIAMNSSGEIIDPCGGTADIASGRLRFTGDPADRLREDPLRAVRLARFAATLPYFSIDGASAAACPQFKQNIVSVPPLRIGKEILGSLEFELSSFLGSLESLGILEQVLPFSGKLPDGQRNKLFRRVQVADKISSDRVIKASALLSGTESGSKDHPVSWGWPRLMAREVSSLVRWSPVSCEKMDSGLFARMFRTMGPEWIEKLFLLGLVICLAEHNGQIVAWAANRVKATGYSLRLEKYSGIVTGEDIMIRTGAKAGPVIGKLFHDLDRAIAEGQIKDRESALMLASSLYQEQDS